MVGSNVTPSTLVVTVVESRNSALCVHRFRHRDSVDSPVLHQAGLISNQKASQSPSAQSPQKPVLDRLASQSRTTPSQLLLRKRHLTVTLFTLPVCDFMSDVLEQPPDCLTGTSPSLIVSLWYQIIEFEHSGSTEKNFYLYKSLLLYNTNTIIYTH